MSKTWAFSHTETTKASPEAVWQHWVNVSNWPTEDKNLKTAELKGAFEVGSKIVMQPTNGPKSSVTITEMVSGQSYSTQGSIPLGKLIFSHHVDKTDDGKTSFTHTITVTGPLRKLFIKLVVQKLADDLPIKMQNIARLAEESR